MDQKNVSRDGADLAVFRDVLGSMRYRCTQQLKKLMPGRHPDHDPKVQKSAFGEYFLVLSVDRSRKERKPLAVDLTVDERECAVSLKLVCNGTATASIDPGVRKTLTTYSPENREATVFGHRQAADLMALMVQYDKLSSRLQNRKTDAELRDWKKLQALKRERMRVRRRVFYLKKEYRDQVANHLAQRYDVLLVPKFETGDLSKRVDRRLKTKVVRQMLSLGHASIFDRLKEQCADYGTTFVQVNEHYTSQTCVRCGTLNKCNETYHCRSCGFTCDRDVVGAAGIYLKAVRVEPPVKHKNSRSRAIENVRRGADS
jgi:transposase